MIGQLVRRGRLVAVVCVTASLLTAGTAAAAPIPSAQPSSRLDPDQETAAESLSRDFSVPLGEARARIDRQAGIGRLADLLPNQLGNAYAGTFIDNAHGGRAVVLTTAVPAPDRQNRVQALASAQGLSMDSIETRVVRHSLGELAAINRTIGDRLVKLNDGAAAPLSAWVDIAGNQVVVALPEHATATTEQRTLIADAQARYGDALAVGTYPGPAIAGACVWPHCDPPLRGGLWIAAGSNPDRAAYCTSGFTARSRADGKWYLVTAGHCDKEHPGVVWAEKFTGSKTPWHPIGQVLTTRSVWDSRGDAAIIAIDNPAGWSPQGRVYVRQSSGVRPTAEDPLYAITGVGGHDDVPLCCSPPGYYVCHTGATWGTSCGPIQKVGVTLSYDGHTVQGLGQVNMPVCQGDSGGPVYVNHLGLGIFVAFNTTSGTKIGPNGESQTCGVTAYYQGLNGLQDLLNVNIVVS